MRLTRVQPGSTSRQRQSEWVARKASALAYTKHIARNKPKGHRLRKHVAEGLKNLRKGKSWTGKGVPIGGQRTILRKPIGRRAAHAIHRISQLKPGNAYAARETLSKRKMLDLQGHIRRWMKQG